MTQLPNDCKCSTLIVNPKNWETGGVLLLKKNWHIQYYFYEPNKPAKLIRLKKGLNRLKTLAERRAAVKIIIDNELKLLQEQAYNPISCEIMKATTPNEDISPSTPFIVALNYAFNKIVCSNETKLDIKSIIKYTTVAAEKLHYQIIEISQIRRKHIKLLLDMIGQLPKVNFTPNRFNVYRKYLHRLFEELIELEALENNSVKRIRKMQTVTKMQTVLTLKERKQINEHLKTNHFTFWRFCQIFFHSGGRITEILKVQKKDIKLEVQKYKATIMKGKLRTEVWRTIKDNILPLWADLYEMADKEDYIFAKGLVPGPESIGADKITERWKTHVKDKLGITANLYSLKHLNLDEIATILDVNAASKMAGHTSTVVTMEHYLVGEKEREHARLKSIRNEF